ncbi:STM4014 family protein, partial [Streptomyces sp. S6]
MPTASRTTGAMAGVAGTPAHASTGTAPPAPRPAPALTVVGNPENRRVTLYTDAVRAVGLPAPRVVAWTGVLAAGGA